MKKDIPQRKVEDVAVAIVPRAEGADHEELWDVYLVNLKEEPLKSVLVNSRGYGSIEGDKMRTTVLRHFFEEVGPLRCIQIEPIQVKLFELTNEYWVSFVYDEYMFDKKYVFVKGSITPTNFTMVPFLDRRGVMIR